MRSDNISALTLAREVISREATQRGTPLTINFTLNDQTIAHFIDLLHPRIEKQLRLARQAALLDSVQVCFVLQNLERNPSVVGAETARNGSFFPVT